MNYKNKRVLVTGGASFIASHLVEKLLELGAYVRIVDNFSTGKVENIEKALYNYDGIELVKADLREPGVARRAMEDIEIVFHLAADHGGRGYIDLHQANTASNFFLDGIVFWEAARAGVKKIVFSSSGCVYPRLLQSDPNKEVYLNEKLIKQPYDADNLYGWAKLMGEETLRAYSQELGMSTVSLRYFTVYGPRCLPSHAITAIILRALLKQNPFEVWGNGKQVRNWTHVEDIVRGTLLAGEKITNGLGINLGTMERIRVIDAVKMVLNYTNHKAKIKFLENMPTGPLNRSADNHLAKELLDWEPKYSFKKGLEKTIDWYIKNADLKKLKKDLEKRLTER